MRQLRLLSCGSNAKGQLAIGTQEDTPVFKSCLFGSITRTGDLPSPCLPPDTEQVIKTATGANHTLILLRKTPVISDGRLPSSPHAPTNHLYGCGDTSRGQLGSLLKGKTPTYTSTFQRMLMGVENRGYEPVDIAAAWETSYVVLRAPSPLQSDLLLSLGADDFGDLGVGSQKNTNPTKDLKGKRRKTTSEDGYHHVSFDRALRDRPEAYQITSLTAGTHHVLAVLQIVSTGEQILAGWGSSRHGQLGQLPGPKQPSFVDAPIRIELSPSHPRLTSAAAGNQHSVLRLASGRLVALGSNRKLQIQGLPEVGDVCDVQCTWNGTYATSGAGAGAGHRQLWVTGSNNKGQLGLGQDLQDGVRPQMIEVGEHFSTRSLSLQHIACGSEHVLATLRYDGIINNEDPCDQPSSASASPSQHQTEIWGWGWNEHGNLGIGNQDDVLSPVRVWPPLTAFPLSSSSNSIHTEPRITGAADAENYAGWVARDIWAGCGTSWILVEKVDLDT